MSVRTSLVVAALLVSVLPAGLSRAAAENPPAPTQAAADLSTPEAALRSFLRAINQLDVNGASCVAGGTVTPLLVSWAEDAKRSKDVFEVTLISCEPQITGDTASVKATIEAKHDKEQQRFEETVSLRKVGSDWKIVPMSVEQLDKLNQDDPKNPHVLAIFATIYAHPDVVLRARNAARTAVCLSNLKQLATGALMFLQDNDEKFALKENAYKAALLPYVRNQDVFHCPSAEAAGVTYSFNPQLAGKSLAAIRKPAQTIMLYEGKKGALNFRHDGCAVVAMVDGRVKKVTPTEARALRWAP